MKIQILGGGCASCARLEANARKACEELGAKAAFSKVSDYAKIASLGVMSVPALVVDGKAVSEGRVLSVAEIKEILGG